eukprot:Phypoly_transcript_19639.p1 GENE.Phypoly_transcript_19639~~Phypoly_transcript_19639.p1  ORF type:complete len:138 (+),score=6.42 Phypoly_transcript_19639:246-659(+)
MASTSVAIVFLLSLVVSVSQASLCTNHTTCGECTSDFECVWCHTLQACAEGTFHGGKVHCDAWRWKQCKVNGDITLWVAIGALAFIILLVAGITARVCYVRQLAKEGKTYDLISGDEPSPKTRLRSRTQPEYLPYAL